MSNSIKFRYDILYVNDFQIIILKLKHSKHTEPTCKILKGSQQQVNTTTTVSIILIICKKRGRRLD